MKRVSIQIFSLNRGRYVRGAECNVHFWALQASDRLADTANRFRALNRPREALGWVGSCRASDEGVKGG